MDERTAYFGPDSTVLNNKVGLTSAEALRAFEYEATRQRAEELRAAPIPGRFDTAHFRAIHRHLFQDVYDWAGEYRIVDFSKGDSFFAPVKTPAHTLESWGETILRDLAQEQHLKGLEKPQFVERLTHHYGELNFWHPMREGNGRATKEFLFQLALQAGYRLAFDRIDAKTWNTAAERQTSGDDPSAALAVFNAIAIPNRALAFRDEPMVEAVKRFPELAGAAQVLYAAKRHGEVEYEPGTAQRFLVKVREQLFERLSAGELVKMPAVEPIAPTRQDPFIAGR